MFIIIRILNSTFKLLTAHWHLLFWHLWFTHVSPRYFLFHYGGMHWFILRLFLSALFYLMNWSLLTKTAWLLIAILRTILRLIFAFFITKSLDSNSLICNFGCLCILSFFLFFLFEEPFPLLLQFHILSSLCFRPITLKFRLLLLRNSIISSVWCLIFVKLLL